MANNSASTYHSHSVGILGVGPFSHAVQFLPCGWVPNTFENMVALNTAVACRGIKFGEMVKKGILILVKFKFADLELYLWRNNFFTVWRIIALLAHGEC